VSLADRWERTFAQLHEQGRFRTLKPPAGIDFASNDYLGYAGSRCVLPPSTTLSTSGVASRLLRGHHPVWDEVEARLAAWHGAEAALVFTSGYAANEGLLSTVIGPRDWVASDRLNHACIGDGLRLAGVKPFKFKHNDLNHLEEGLHEAATNRKPEQELFIVTETLFSMDGDSPDLGGLNALAERYDAHLILDEAHATGCYGKRGAGLVEHFVGRSSRLLATMHTGGKALGVPGAYVVGSQKLKDWLVNRCRHFIFTTALPPAVGEWWLAMLDRVPADTEGRAKLRANCEYFAKRIPSPPPPGVATRHPSTSPSGGEVKSVAEVEAMQMTNHTHLPPSRGRSTDERSENGGWGGQYSPIVPIILGDDAKAVTTAERLQFMGFDVRAVRPPTVPEGTARLRISIHADHTFEQLDALASAIREVLA
jgi:8-amino-7-oxononanoate synthase